MQESERLNRLLVNGEKFLQIVFIAVRGKKHLLLRGNKKFWKFENFETKQQVFNRSNIKKNLYLKV